MGSEGNLAEGEAGHIGSVGFMIRVVAAEPEHIPPFVERVRREDRIEWAAGGMVPMSPHMVRSTVQARLAPENHRVYAVLVDGRPEVLFGCGRQGHTDIGFVWLAATTHANKWQVGIHKACLHYLGEFEKMCPGVLVGDSFIENVKHHQWLEWCGFKCDGYITNQETGHVFKRYIRPGITTCAHQ